jgi:hypothetical protein
MTNIAIFLLVLVLAVLAFTLYRERLEAPSGDAPATTTAAYTRGDVSWDFRDEGEDPVALAPRTRVVLEVSGEEHDLGVRQGSCAAAQASALAANELAAATCWFAGAGDEFRVTQPSAGRIVVLHREIEEGTAEGPAVETQFRALLTI